MERKIERLSDRPELREHIERLEALVRAMTAFEFAALQASQRPTKE